MALHQIHHILHQQIALHLHNGGGRGADEQHHEIIARFGIGVLFIVFVKLGIVKRDFNHRAFAGDFVEVHAQIVQRLAKIFIPRNRPAHLQYVLAGNKANAGFVFKGADRALRQGARSCILPKGFEHLRKLFHAHFGAQRNLSMHMNMKRCVV